MEKNSNMVSCKVCGNEIAANAKTCPHCGTKCKKKKPILIGVIILVVLLIIIGSAGGDDEPTKVENPQGGGSSSQAADSPSSPAKDDKTKFYVGETAELRDVLVTFVSVTESSGSTYNKPTEGNVFVICEFEIVNNSKSEINISSMLCFDAYCDDYACTYSLSALLERGNKNQLDATVAPGKKLNGVIGYEVPEDFQELEISFTPDFWSGKEIIFVATNE